MFFVPVHPEPKLTEEARDNGKPEMQENVSGCVGFSSSGPGKEATVPSPSLSSTQADSVSDPCGTLGASDNVGVENEKKPLLSK